MGISRTAVPLLFILILSCAPLPAPQPSWTFEKGAIRIGYRADPMLNAYDGAAHTVVLAVYQLTGPEMFSDVSKTREGILSLLEGKKFDGSVVGYGTWIIQPGQEGVIRLDRSDNARWVGIVAGYYDLAPDRVTAALSIPVVTKTTGVFRKRTTVKISPLLIDLPLGNNGIQRVGKHS